VKLFLDTSVLLAACGSAKGASRAIFHLAPAAGWTLMSSPYVLSEVLRNLGKLPVAATAEWVRLRRQLIIVDDIVSLDRPVIFLSSKDRPILFTALAWSHTLLTLDREDFADLLDGEFYGLRVHLPFSFLEVERAEGRLKIPRP
jgi:predicted nucleic acid-binding protein